MSPSFDSSSAASRRRAPAQQSASKAGRKPASSRPASCRSGARLNHNSRARPARCAGGAGGFVVAGALLTDSRRLVARPLPINSSFRREKGSGPRSPTAASQSANHDFWKPGFVCALKGDGPYGARWRKRWGVAAPLRRAQRLWRYGHAARARQHRSAFGVLALHVRPRFPTAAGAPRGTARRAARGWRRRPPRRRGARS